MLSLVYFFNLFLLYLITPGSAVSKPQIAVEMIRYLREIGVRFKLVLADSLYGESHSTFINVLNELQLNYAVAIRSNHGMLLPSCQRVRENRWRKFDRIWVFWVGGDKKD